jgi:hypothetical protein
MSLLSAVERNNLKLTNMQVKITSKGHRATFQLYNTRAAKEFYNQLPLHLDLTNFRKAQWMFYPPKKLKTDDTPLVSGAVNGTLAYYAPWGDVVMFYGRFGSASGLYELGEAVSGAEHISGISGKVQIEKE